MKKKIGVLLLTVVMLASGCGALSEAEDVITTSETKSQNMMMSDASMESERGMAIEPMPPIIAPGDPADGENYMKITENAFIKTADENTSTFSIDVDTASYANLRSQLAHGYLPESDSIRIEEMINYFDYDYPQPEGDIPFSVTTATTKTPWNSNTVVTMIGIQGKEVDMSEAPPSNIVLLVDVSGSMQDANKLPLLKQTFGELVENLTARDRVSMVVYAGAAGVVLEGAEGADKEEILAALNRLEAGGSTAGGEGIELAYKVAEKYYIENGNNRVVLASDGDFNVGMSSVEELEAFIAEKRMESDVYFSSVGFGRGNLNDAIMETLADKGNGNYSYIDSYAEAKKVFGSEFMGTMYAIAKDVKIQVEFNNDAVESYRLIGYENRVMENKDFEDDTKDAGELGSGHTVTAMYEVVLRSGLDFENDALYEVRLRYKEPNGFTSKRITVEDRGINYSDGNANLSWALAVAEFGMILRQSEYAKDANTEQVLALAREAIKLDYDEYKEEFIQMVRQYDAIAAPVPSTSRRSE